MNLKKVIKPKNSLHTYLLFFVLTILNTDILASVWVTNFSEDRENIQILRNDSKISLKIYTQLNKNDKIIINNKESFLEIESDSGEILIINQDNSPFEIKDEGTSSILAENIQQWISGWLGVSENKNRIVGLNSRGNTTTRTIYFPHIPTTKTNIIKTNKSFLLKWLKGSPPFKLSVINIQNGNEELLIRNINNREYSIPLTKLMGNNYLITVSGKYTSNDFLLQIADKNKLPSMPKELSNLSLPFKMQQLLYYIWLSDTDNYVWRLQAFNYASILAKNYYPAEIFLNKLNKFQTYKLNINLTNNGYIDIKSVDSTLSHPKLLSTVTFSHHR